MHIDALAALLEKEHLVFQNHVLELVQDVLENSIDYWKINPLSGVEISEFLQALPPVPGYQAQSEPVRQLIPLANERPDIARLIASELIHRRRWEEVMAKYPDTLPELKRRLDP